MTTMTRLVQAELLKLRTTRVVLALLATTVVMTVIGVVATILTAGTAQGSFPLDTPEGVRNVLASGQIASTLVLILGVLGVTGEFRHGTITATFLITPQRRQVVAAKVVAYALLGLVFAAVASIVTLVVALPWLRARDVDVSLFDGQVWRVVVGLVVAAALSGVLGVGFGALIRNQVAAVVSALVWSFLLEGLLVALLPEVGKWGPGGASTALAGTSTTEGDLLAPWTAGLLLAAYGFALAMIGTRFVVRRDVT